MDIVEVESGGTLLGYVINAAEGLPHATSFITPHDANLQVGFVVKSASDEVPRHDHKPVQRSIVGTSEVLIVTKGSGEIDFYDEKREYLSTHFFKEGDVLVMLAGGHGFRFGERTVLLEVKQGPYPGVDEKERF